MQLCPPASHRRTPFGAPLLAWAIFAPWLVMVGVIVGGLGARHPMTASFAPGPLPLEAAGWTLRFELPVSDPASADLAAYLLRRGPFPGVREEIHVATALASSGAAPSPAWLTALTQAGWAVELIADSARPPPAARLTLLDPRATLRWSGRFDSAAEDARTVAASFDVARPLDAEIVARVVLGQPVPPRVPFGCAPGA